MNTTELNIRNYLKTFSVEDIANSVYLFGINFDTAPIDTIIESLDSLYEEVKTLKSMIDRNFESQNGELLPKSPMVQAGIAQDCYRKESALLKALSNQDIYNTFVNYKMSETKKSSGPTK